MSQEKDPNKRFRVYHLVNEDTLEDFTEHHNKDQQRGYCLAAKTVSARITGILKTAQDYASLRKELLEFQKSIKTAEDLVRWYDIRKTFPEP